MNTTQISKEAQEVAAKEFFAFHAREQNRRKGIPERAYEQPMGLEVQQAIDAATAELRQDKKRMDWLEESNHADLLHCDCRAGHYIEGLDMATQPNVRAAIDKAMKKKPCSSP